MNNRKVAALLLAVCALLAVAPVLSAREPRQSHRPIPGASGALDESELAGRLQAAQDLSLVRALAEKMLKDPKNFNLNDTKKQELLKQFLKDPNTKDLLGKKEVAAAFRDALQNPNLKPDQLKALSRQFERIPPEKLEELAQAAQKNPGKFNLSEPEAAELGRLAQQARTGKQPPDAAKWTELLKKFSQNPNVPSGNIDVEALQRALPDFTPPTPDGSDPLPKPVETPSPADDPNPAVKPETPEDKAASPSAADNKEALAEWLSKGADWLQDVDPDSKLLGEVADMLRSAASGDGEDLKPWAKDVVGKGADVIGWLSREGDWPLTEQAKTVGSWMDKWSPPAPPNLGGNSSLLPGTSTPGGSLPSTGSLNTEQLARFFVWALALAVIGGAACWLLVRYRGSMEMCKGGLPGYWPVRPGNVATRGDLVRAFEYLALLLLGVEARPRHHLDLAQRLGKASPESAERQRTAHELAHLYELARYAPADEVLPEADLAAARRALTFLAGAGAA